MGEKEINITYETLFELLRREKNREELQELDGGFFEDVKDYLKEKKAMIKDDNELFSADNSENIKKQIENAKKIIKELYEKREKKIADLAIYKSRTRSDLVDSSRFLEKEKQLFDMLVELFTKYRKDVLISILNGEKIITQKEEEKTEATKKQSVSEPKESEEKTEETKEETLVSIRFLHAVPKFIGKELETYGPFEAEDVANLPKEIAKVLIDKERAKKIESTD